MSTTAELRTLSARGRLHGMRVIFAGREDETEWTVLDRHPNNGRWWLHRRTETGEWVTTDARYSELVQIL